MPLEIVSVVAVLVAQLHAVVVVMVVVVVTVVVMADIGNKQSGWHKRWIAKVEQGIKRSQ